MKTEAYKKDGDPGRIRTCDRPLRRRMLYPAELRDRIRRKSSVCGTQMEAVLHRECTDDGAVDAWRRGICKPCRGRVQISAIPTLRNRICALAVGRCFG